jgi:hypothetical protein
VGVGPSALRLRRYAHASGAPLHPGAGVVQVPDGLFVGTCAGESEAGHVDVDALRAALGDLVRFVPNADGTVVADALVKGPPCGQVGGSAGLGVTNKLVETAPVLSHHDPSPVEGGVTCEEAKLRIRVEFADHGRHCLTDGNPFIESEQAVDTEADKEDHEGAFYAGAEATRIEGGHLCKPITRIERT